MLSAKQPDRTRREFEELTLDHLDALYSAALRLTKDERDAEDLVQDAYLRAFRFFDKFERGTNIKAWLFKILTNTFINRYRRKVKERAAVDGPERDAVHARVISPDATQRAEDPETHFINNLMSDEVLQALDALPVDFRMVVVLSDLQEFSYKEIAEILECPVGTVMSRLFRGRRLLQKGLAAYAADRGVQPVNETEPAGDDPVRLDDYRARAKSK
jgi:RNA polymerase sigma-70 factor, ECF subfamily